MPKHITIDNDIHEFTSHSISTVSWSGSQNIEIYNITEHNAATFIGRITNGTNTTKLIIHLADDDTNTGMEVVEIAIGSEATMLDLTFSANIVSNDLVLNITNANGGDTNTLKYYLFLSDL